MVTERSGSIRGEGLMILFTNLSDNGMCFLCRIVYYVLKSLKCLKTKSTRNNENHHATMQIISQQCKPARNYAYHHDHVLLYSSISSVYENTVSVI